MACLFGALIARGGQAHVTLAGSWPAAIEAIDGGGILVEEADGEFRVSVVAKDLHSALGNFDLVLVLVKSGQTALIAPHVARCLGPDGVMVTLQNGLGNVETLAGLTSRERTGAGVTSLGATILAPGHVRWAGRGPTIVGPAVAGAVPDSLVRAVDLLAASDLSAELVTDIDPYVWQKLAVNCAINPLSAILAVPNGALINRPEPRATLLAAAREVGAVAAALGIDFLEDPASAVERVARRTADNRSSMLQDVDRGFLTEIDAINGAVVRLGRSHGIPTPVNEALWRHVRAIEGRPLESLPEREEKGRAAATGVLRGS
jgi:2-dehydropantoate 2-reductase